MGDRSAELDGVGLWWTDVAESFVSQRFFIEGGFMAKRQTRRTFSVSRATYEVATRAAAEAGVAASEWITQLIRAARPELEPQSHMSPGAVAAMVAAKEPRTVVHVPNATAEPPPRPVIRGPVETGFCAVCTSERGPFTRSPIGKDDARVLVCESCATPAFEMRSAG